MSVVASYGFVELIWRNIEREGNMATDGTFRTNRERRSIRSGNIFQKPMGVCVSITHNGMRQNINNGKENKENNGTNVLPDSLGWDAMIRDAKKRIEDLKFSIELFEKKKAAGERWPGAQSEDQGARRNTALFKTLRQFPAS
jgi:hypothetical protein